MKIGFIIPLLNGADHLAGLLVQIVRYGQVAIIEYSDSSACLSELNDGKSLDGSYKIAEQFSRVTFVGMGKVKDRRSALNKGLEIFHDAEYIVVLRQGDSFLDIQYLIDELELNDRITTRRYMFYPDFGHFFLDKKREIAFRNIKEFGKLSYSVDPFAVSSLDGHALKDYNVRTLYIDNILANFRMITSKEKRKRFLYQEQKEERHFTFGSALAKDFLLNDVKEPFSREINDKTAFLNSVSHPWKEKEKGFLDNLPLLPFVGVDEWIECLGEKYTDIVDGENQNIKPRVLGINCSFLSDFFESEGWNFSTEPEGKYDLIFSISKIPDMDEAIGHLEDDGNIVVVNSLETIDDIRYKTIFLEEEEGLFSFVVTRRNEDG